MNKKNIGKKFFKKLQIEGVYLLVFAFGFLPAIGQATEIFTDDFESGLSKWTIGGSPSPSIINIPGPGGPNSNVFSTNDDLSGGGYGVTNEIFDYVGVGFNVTADVKHGNAAFADQKKSGIGLSNVTTGSAFFLVELFGAASNPVNSVRVNFEGGTPEVFGITNGDDWHNLGFSILDTGIIRVLLDGVVVATTTQAINATYDGNARIFLGNRNSFYDNVSVSSVPEPLIITLIGLGLAGIGYQRQHSKKAA